MKGKKLKVLHLIWWGEIGGISLNLVDLISETRDIRNYVCLLNKGGAVIPALSARSEMLFEIKARSGFDIRGAYRVRQLIKEIKVDLVHLHSPTYIVAIALLLLKRRPPVVFQEHGRLQQKQYRAKAKLFYKVFHKIFACFISISEDTARAMGQIGIPSDKIVILNNPVNSSYFNPGLARKNAKEILGIPGNSLVVGTACRFATEKDLPLFIKIVNKVALTNKSVLFLMVGGGDLKKELVNQAELYGISKRTLFINFRLDMVTVWRAIDIFLFTSKIEAFGRTLIESLSCETPIVAALPMTGGAIDIIKRCPGIINTGGRNEKMIAEAIQKLLGSEEQRNQLGRLGREWVIERYDIKKWAAQMTQLYYALCNHLYE